MQYNDCWGNTVYELTSAILKGVPTHSRGLELEELSGSFQAKLFYDPCLLGNLATCSVFHSVVAFEVRDLPDLESFKALLIEVLPHFFLLMPESCSVVL